MIDSIEARLRGTMPQLRTVAGAVEFAALQAPPLPAKLPAAYVMPVADEAAPNSLASMLHRQVLTATIRVALITRDLRDTRGDAALTTLDALRRGLRQALAGWTPPGARSALELRRGALLDFQDGTLTWAEDFSCTENLEVAP